MIVIGDTHGKINDFINLIKRYKIENEVLIQVGDFGVGFTLNPSLGDFNYFLMENNIYLYILRGNHDDPKFFINQEEKSQLHYSNIEFLKDYSVLNIQNKKILLIGGGISLDRQERKENVSWWSGENIVLDVDRLKGLSKEKFDVLITHVPCPGIFIDDDNYTLKYWTNIDKSLNESLKIEKEKLLEIKSNIDYEYWISGHMHISNRISQNNKKYIILNELEFLSIDRESND